ncbi:DNA methyltransferase [Catenulispora rubra]|uniref:TRM11 family SAM-dependent methyltransferase n=1 Tax=Catenulispora rubra TaxID=280293 RepID=UPI0018924083|nr:DNA methyltransferase [Catenulispora rubra]
MTHPCPQPDITDPDSAAAEHSRSSGALSRSVWLTAQRNSRSQRVGRYLPESVAHPAKMLPQIVRHAITAYTSPGDLVVDPMCGIGTTLVEALHLGRNGFGVEYEQRWADLAEQNIDLARLQGAGGYAEVVHADARAITQVVPRAIVGKAALVITSPPYGASLHGQVKPTAETGTPGVQKFDYRYSTDRGNLAHASYEELIDGFAQILSGCRELLKPGGIVAVTARPWREHGELVDLPGEVIAAGIRAGLTPVERCVALLAGIRDGEMIARPSFFQLANIRRKREEGEPQAVIVHEDVLIFANLPTSRSSSGPEDSAAADGPPPTDRAGRPEDW